MKITFDMDNAELTSIITEQIKQQAIEFFQSKKDDFVKNQVERHVVDLKRDGFFSRQVSSSLNKAIYDKVNREFDGFIKDRINTELEKVFKTMNVSKLIDGMVDKRVKEKLKILIDKS